MSICPLSIYWYAFLILNVMFVSDHHKQDAQNEDYFTSISWKTEFFSQLGALNQSGLQFKNWLSRLSYLKFAHHWELNEKKKKNLQVGMFWFSGLSPEQIEQLRSRFHIYITPDSRIR